MKAERFHQGSFDNQGEEMDFTLEVLKEKDE